MIDTLTINCTLKDDFESKPYTTVASNISALNKSMICTLHSVLSMVCAVGLWIAVKSADPLFVQHNLQITYMYVYPCFMPNVTILYASC